MWSSLYGLTKLVYISQGNAYMQTDRPRKIPIYQRILTDLRVKIQSDAYNREHMSLSENTLAKQYHISRMTARRIMQELAYEGLVNRKQGRATVLNPSRKTVDLPDV